jgi:5-formyltetrahydrofolate cyclo-ligase
MGSIKSALRGSLKQARLAINPDIRGEKSLAINSGLLHSVDWSGIRDLHCFEPIERLGEVDVTSFLRDLKENYPDTGIYTSRKIDGAWQVVPFGSDEPLATVPKLDAVIVPMLGFDPKTLHRIGYGGGYYDKFLVTQPGARKIGVCFEQGKLEKFTSQPHDIPMDVVVTESKVYSSASASTS